MNAKRPLTLYLLLATLAVAISATVIFSVWPRQPWSEEELTALQGLWIGSLPPLPPDPSNAYADDMRAAKLGQQLFFDTRLSANGQVACATCHKPEQDFQDGTPLAHGIGTTNRRTMTVVGTAYSPWLFWDGRKDSLWAQALGPLENAVEHGGNRTQYAHLIARHYRGEYEALFGPLPDLSGLPPHAGPVDDPAVRAAWDEMALDDQEAVTRVYVNIGKAIAAYQRLLVPGPAPFDAYVEAILAEDYERAEALMDKDEIAGLRLFIGEADCTQCHNGPLFTNNDFHNTGVPVALGLPEDRGRASGAAEVVADPFNCLSVYSDAPAEACAELRFLVLDAHRQERQFKPPSLRNVAGREPFMHAGQFATLEEVLAHYNMAPAAPAGHTELEPLNLTTKQMNQITAFLRTLNGPVAADSRWLAPPPSAQASQ